jgi:hypothetical protein
MDKNKCVNCGEGEKECVCGAGSCAMPGVCACPHHKITPLIFILIGLVFLLKAMGAMSAVTVSYSWPLLVIIYGLAKIMGGSCGCYRKHY